MKPNIKDFIEKTFTELNAAKPDGFELSEEIEFEISLVTTVEANGKFDFKIASAGISGNDQAVQKIKFKYSNIEQAAKNIEAQASTVESMMFAIFNPLVEISKKFEKPKSDKGKIEGVKK